MKSYPRAFLCIASVACLLFATPVAARDLLLLDQQGVSPNRVVAYASTFVRDRSPISLDLSNIQTVKQVEMTMVFEGIDRPYFTHTWLDIRCPTIVVNTRGREMTSTTSADPTVEPQAVQFRLDSGFTRTKSAFDITKLEPGDWQSSASTMMKRAYLLACNSRDVEMAVRSSIDSEGNLDAKALSDLLAPIGLADAPLFPPMPLPIEVAEVTWAKVWTDVQMPPINNGRDLTPVEIAEEKSKIEERLQALNVQREASSGRIEAMQAEFKFREEAARLRGGRKMNETEAAMLMAWKEKSEREVVIAMGAPNVSESAGIRFLAYGQDYDSRYVVQRVVSGQTWVEGVYRSCNIQFVLIPDTQSDFRVVDVVVTRFRSGDGWAPDQCDGLAQAPRS